MHLESESDAQKRIAQISKEMATRLGIELTFIQETLHYSVSHHDERVVFALLQGTHVFSPFLTLNIYVDIQINSRDGEYDEYLMVMFYINGRRVAPTEMHHMVFSGKLVHDKFELVSRGWNIDEYEEYDSYETFE